MVVGLVILAVITVGVETKIDTSLIESSGFLNASLLGWQLIYILPVAVLTNDFFISGFWMRTFASKTDKDLVLGTSIATVVVTCILALVGSTGLLAAWSGAWPGDPPQDGSIALFLLLGQLPAWVIGIILVMVVSLSTAAFDSLQSAMVSTGSNDLFRNKLNLWWIRLAVVLVIFPVVVVALKSPDILQVYLISDLVSASSVPVLVLGLSERFYWWRGFEVVVGGLGGLMTVFIFGTIYFGDAHEGAYLLLLENGLYSQDWSAFGQYYFFLFVSFALKKFPPPVRWRVQILNGIAGAFVAAPIGGLLWGFGACALRLGYLWIQSKRKGVRFDAFDRPAPPSTMTPATEEVIGDRVGLSDDDREDSEAAYHVETQKGRFY